MSKNTSPKKLKKQVAQVNVTPRDSKIPRGVVDVREVSTEHEYPVFSFDFVDDSKFELWNADKEYLKLLIKTYKTMGNLTWNEMRQAHGLGMKVITTRYTLPAGVSPDVDLIEVRVSQEGRLHGFRIGRTFQVLWFDPHHKVCPENKVRR